MNGHKIKLKNTTFSAIETQVLILRHSDQIFLPMTLRNECFSFNYLKKILILPIFH